MQKVQFERNSAAADVIAAYYRRTPKLYVHSFGCQQNVNDGEKIAGVLCDIGFSMCSKASDADMIVFNTCAVREHAEQRVFGNVGALKALKEENPKLMIAVCGCMTQQKSVVDKFRQSYPFVDIVTGVNKIDLLPKLLCDRIAKRRRVLQAPDDRPDIVEGMPLQRGCTFRAWLPIMYGCDNFCSYCIVPYVRGRERSRTSAEIMEEFRSLVAQGYKDITLLGQNVNSYGRDLYGEPRFADVLRAVDAAGIERLRFATSHPKDLTDEVIGLFATLPSLMPALHLPVQSGSNRILSAMNRRYTREHYLGLIEKLRRARPDIALSTDIIVGFPGETEEDFMDTYRLVEEVGYSQVFTFIYSKREGTPAAEMDDDTPREVIQERFDRLVDLVQRKAFEANQAELGATVPVLVEGTSKRDDSILAGKSPKNQTVHAPVPSGTEAASLVGRIVPVTIEEARTWYLSGTIAHA